MSKKKDRLYGRLVYALSLAYDEAAFGKGKERHANNKPFEEQTMMVANRVTAGGFSWGQIFKKIQEIPNIKDFDLRKAEMVSIIVYAAGWVLWFEEYMKNNTVLNLRRNLGGNLDNITGVVDSKDFPEVEE